MTVCVLSKYGERLMPTDRLGKVRRMLKDGRAVIINRNPFTIKLTYDTSDHVQPMELCMDTGYQHIDLSIKSKAKEHVASQYDMLTNEKEKHDDCRKYRRTRRNRLRYRKPRFDNRAVPEGWIAPSLLNKANCHVQIIKNFMEAMPISKIIIEAGSFDTQLIQAIQEGKPIPEGTDYQQGERYGIDSLREAVFQRDHHKCIVCGRSGITDGAVLHVHHMYYWRGQHGSRLSELATVCDKCHTPANHKEGGKLYGLDKKLPRYNGAAFMNTVRWHIFNQVRGFFPDVKITYGAATKRSRIDLGLEKSHINDAFSMGNFHPLNRAETFYYKKRRRNNRVLSKFYDAKYIDSRDGQKKSGSQLFNGRISRNHKKDSENLHIYRQKKISKGRVSVRRQRYSIQSGDRILFEGKVYTSKGVHNNGTRVILEETKKSVAINKVKTVRHISGWQLLN